MEEDYYFVWVLDSYVSPCLQIWSGDQLDRPDWRLEACALLTTKRLKLLPFPIVSGCSPNGNARAASLREREVRPFDCAGTASASATPQSRPLLLAVWLKRDQVEHTRRLPSVIWRGAAALDSVRILRRGRGIAPSKPGAAESQIVNRW